MEDKIKEYLANWSRKVMGRPGGGRIARSDAYHLAYNAYKTGVFELFNSENSEIFDKEFFQIISVDADRADLKRAYMVGRVAGQAFNVRKIRKIKKEMEK